MRAGHVFRLLALTLTMISCDFVSSYIRGDRCITPGPSFPLNTPGMRLARFDTRPCVGVGSEPQSPHVLLYVLELEPSPPSQHTSQSCISALTHYTVRADDDVLDIDTRAGTAMVNHETFALRDGNLLIKSAVGTCGPRAHQLRVTASDMSIDNILVTYAHFLEGRCKIPLSGLARYESK